MKTLKERFDVLLKFTDESLHADPHMVHVFSAGRVFAYYQLASGSWKIGARDASTGDVLWHREPPRAEMGTHFSAMHASKTRLYVAFDNRLEVFDAASGETIGVVW